MSSDAPLDLKREQQERAGCRILRRTRAGLLVGLYNSAEAHLESAPGCEWSIVCEEHGGIVGHATLAVARSWLPHPAEWCPTCQEARDAGRPAPISSGTTCPPDSAAPAAAAPPAGR